MLKNVPSNKKIAPQRFYSTRKQFAQKKGKKLIKPSKEEAQKIATELVLQHKRNTHSNEEEIFNKGNFSTEHIG